MQAVEEGQKTKALATTTEMFGVFSAAGKATSVVANAAVAAGVDGGARAIGGLLALAPITALLTALIVGAGAASPIIYNSIMNGKLTFDKLFADGIGVGKKGQ